MKSVVLIKSMSEIERVDTESVLGILSTRWMECWQDLPADAREASSEQVDYASSMMHGCLNVYHSVQSTMLIMIAALIHSIWLIA